MIVVSQPSANPLFPGFGSRRFNMLDQKLGNFVGLGREVVRDLAFHPVTPELLLSCGQDKVVKVTNMVSCSEVVRSVPLLCDKVLMFTLFSSDSRQSPRCGPATGQLLLLTPSSTSAPRDLRSGPGFIMAWVNILPNAQAGGWKEKPFWGNSAK